MNKMSLYILKGKKKTSLRIGFSNGKPISGIQSRMQRDKAIIMFQVIHGDKQEPFDDMYKGIHIT